jgi:hypothetical protein
VQYRIIAGCGNTPYDGKGYYHDRLCRAIAQELFCNINKSSSEASTPTCGGDTFVTELIGIELRFQRGIVGGEPLAPHRGDPQ